MNDTPCNTTSGFTLMEIMIAILILGIVLGTIFGSINQVFSNADTINEDITSHELGKVCLNRMVQDLRSLHISLPPEYKKPKFNNPPDQHRIVGDSDDGEFPRLRFTSLAHVSFEESDRDGIAEVLYYVEETEENGNVLRRADNLYPYERFTDNQHDERDSDPVLCQNVKSLRFTYYDDEEIEHAQWDSESNELKYATPKAVKILLEIGKEESASLFFETMIYFPLYRGKIE